MTKISLVDRKIVSLDYDRETRTYHPHTDEDAAILRQYTGLTAVSNEAWPDAVNALNNVRYRVRGYCDNTILLALADALEDAGETPQHIADYLWSFETDPLAYPPGGRAREYHHSQSWADVPDVNPNNDGWAWEFYAYSQRYVYVLEYWSDEREEVHVNAVHRNPTDLIENYRRQQQTP